MDPNEVTNLLKCEPTIARHKGEVISNEKYHIVANTGSWIFEDQSPKKDKIESKIIALLGCVVDDTTIWKKITSQFQVDIFCGIFLKKFNRGFELSPKIMRLLNEREIAIGFDIYCPAT